jgi:hypothetical protein
MERKTSETLLREEKVDKIRDNFNQLVSIFNKIALNPYEPIPLSNFHNLMNDLPIQWDLNQIYLILEHFLATLSHTPASFTFIIVDKSFDILDICLIKIEHIDDSDLPALQFSLFPLSQNESNAQHGVPEEVSHFMGELSTKIQNFAPFQSFVESFLKSHLSIFSTHSYLLPFDFAKITHNFFPHFNLDILTSVKKVVDFKNLLQADHMSHDLQQIKYILSSYTSQNWTYDFLLREIQNWQFLHFNEAARFITTLFDDLLVNFLIVSERRKKVLFASRVIIQDHRLILTPLSISIMKGLYDSQDALEDIANKIYKKTGSRTLVLNEQDLQEYFARCNCPGVDLFRIITFTLELVYSKTWYPDSLLNSFLHLFGLELGPGVSEFYQSMVNVVKYFKNVLVISYRNSSSDETSWINFLHFYYQDEVAKIKLLELSHISIDPATKSQSSPQYIFHLKQVMEEQTGIHFNACFGFNVDLLTENLSVKSIEAMLQMSNISHQLPFIATLGALLVGMKGMKADQRDQPLIQPILSPSIEEEPKMSLGKYFDAFLKKGICFLADENQAMSNIRTTEEVEEGYLGLDLKKFQDLLKRAKK